MMARLLTALIRGSGAEFLRGDLEEAGRRGPSPARHLLNVLASLLAWYNPRALFRRGRSQGAGSRGQGRAGGQGLPPIRGGGGGGALGTDLRLALRGLARRWEFSLVVVLTLALGIGATTTIFSVVDSVALRPLPYEDSRSLLALGNTFPDREWSTEVEGLQRLAGVSYLNFREVRERTRTVGEVAGAEMASVLLPDRGEGPEIASMARVTPGFFGLFGISPALGRSFLPGEYGPDGSGVVVISHDTWIRRFGGDPGVVGRPLESYGAESIVVGVLPAGFRPPEALMPTGTEFWMPLDPSHPRYRERGRRSMLVLGRLAPGATVERAREELRVLAADLAREYPDGNVYPDGKHFGWGANRLHAETLGGTGGTLILFLASAALLLLISVLNAGHLFLVRGLDRIGELSVRQALGANRWALARQLLSESSLLALVGGALGVAVAYGGVELFLRWAPGNLPRLGEVSVDQRVLLFSALVSVLAGLVTGVLPLFQIRGREVSTLIRSGGDRRVAAGGSRGRMALVTGQLALALILAVGASLLLDSFLRVRSVDPGFQAENLWTFSMPVKRPGGSEESMWQAWDALLARVNAIPGARAGGASNHPFQSPNWAPAVLLPGEPPETRRTGVAGYVVTPGYLSTLGVPLRAGRFLEPADGAGAEAVALVNEAFVQEVMGGAPAVGTNLRFRGDDGELADLRVVGVVGNVIQTRAQEGMRPAVYVPYTQAEWPVVQVAVRSTRNPVQLAGEIREAARAFTSVIPLRDLSTMEERMGRTRVEPRFHAFLFATFALVALLLAAVGLYGTLAHMVGRRTRELGVRMALGADGGSILGLILRQGLVLAGIGLGLGGVGAFFAARLLESLLFQIPPFHLPAFLLAALTLGLVALLAVLVPARRATGVDPVRAFQAE